MNKQNKKYQVAIIYCGLIAATWIVFGRTYSFDFVGLDDDQYVTANAYVQAPFTSDSLRWAFTTSHFFNWHPLTWLSHMLDYRLFRSYAGGHHLTSVLIHTINTLLLFEILRRLGRTVVPNAGAPAVEEPRWRSAAVALLFCIHHLHVQSVAWIAERKDVLSTCFEFSAILAYLAYAAKPSFARFLLAPVLFAFALMAKSMVVALPGLLLLLDYWPLQRYTGIRNGKGLQPLVSCPRYSWKRLVLEKIPFLVLAAGMCVIAMQIKTPQTVSLPYRLANVPVAYITYLQKTFWPSGLAVFYPHPGDALPLWKTGVCASLMILATLAALLLRRRKPYVFLGWFWYLGMLLPACGIVQISLQGMGDHYTYVPLVGIFIVLVWGAADLGFRISNFRPPLAAALMIGSGAAVAALAVVAFIQVGYWKNGVTLFTHAVEVTRDNERMHVALATNELLAGRNFDQAVRHYQEAIRLQGESPSPDVYNNLGLALTGLGRSDEAALCYQHAIRLKPDYVDAYFNFAVALAGQQRFDEAVAYFRQALLIAPGAIDVQNQLTGTLMMYAVDLVEKGETQQAVDQYREALRINPQLLPAWNNLGNLLNDLGQQEDAIQCYKTALSIDAHYAKAHANLARLLAARGDLAGAARHYQDAVEADPTYLKAQVNLLKILVLLERFGKALTWFRQLSGNPHNDFVELGAFLE